MIWRSMLSSAEVLRAQLQDAKKGRCHASSHNLAFEQIVAETWRHHP